MTQAYNLAILANAVDSSGKLNVATNSTGVLPQANGGTGSTALSSVAVTSLTAGSGISVSASTGSVTISASGGGVTSLNGQTGAITNTGFNNIGSYTAGARAANSNSNPGDTIAGSSIYQYSTNPFTNVQTNIGGASNRGQTGTWRAMAFSSAELMGCGPDWLRSANIWVRVS